MDGTAVKEIAKLREDAFEVDVNGIHYASPNLKAMIFEPEPEPVKVETLQGIVDLIEDPIDEELEDRSKLLIHVVSYKEVILYGELSGKKRKRDLYAKASLSSEFKTFNFGEFMASEAFQIKLRSLFVKTEELEDLMPFIAKLTVTDEVGAMDDGITQTVSVKRGMSGALTEQAAPRPIVTLKPYRTFREVDQPASEFLFRMKAVDGKVPTLALFEADGGKWTIDAVDRIAEFFIERLEGIKVVK